MRSKRSKVNIGDTVYFVVEHYYHRLDRAGAFMEYLLVSGIVKEIISLGYKEVKIKSVIDNVIHLHFYKLSNYGKTFFPNYNDALSAAIHSADVYDRTWSGITKEKIRRPWETENGYARISVADYEGYKYSDGE